MCTEDLKKAVTEAIEAGLFVPRSTAPDEQKTGSYECPKFDNCKYFDPMSFQCTSDHCPYIDEPETDLTEDEALSPYPCSSCKHFDEDLLNCSIDHCPYIKYSEDDLEGQQYFY